MWRAASWNAVGVQLPPRGCCRVRVVGPVAKDVGQLRPRSLPQRSVAIPRRHRPVLMRKAAHWHSLLAGHVLKTSPRPHSGAASREALWQSLAAREPHPAALQWRLTTAARAAHLAGSATSYLASFDPLGKVYVVVLRGHFRPPDAPSTRARRLFLVLEAKGRAYLAHGCTSARRLHLASLGHLHAYVPRLPVRDGLWGHTMVVGGPFPGGPRPLKNVAVVVWQGADAPASDPPLMQVRSDGAGFFVLKLASGAYTLRLSVSGGGPPAPTTVTVKAGRPVAAGVYEDVP